MGWESLITQSERRFLCFFIGIDRHTTRSKLLQLTQKTRKNSPAMQKASTTIDETRFSSLSLRTNEPYWLLHRGDCEHFFVVDQIRYSPWPHADESS